MEKATTESTATAADTFFWPGIKQGRQAPVHALIASYTLTFISKKTNGEWELCRTSRLL